MRLNTSSNIISAVIDKGTGVTLHDFESVQPREEKAKETCRYFI